MTDDSSTAHRAGLEDTPPGSTRSLGDATPRLPAWQEWLLRAVAVVTIAYSAYYVGWRWLHTLNWDALWFAVPLAVAETYILFSAVLMVFTVWKLKRRDPPPAPEGLDVDVYITTYDEPLEIIRRTALGARAISYPHQTWLLDDGKRDRVKELAEELGIGYIRRDGNEHAKAGNLNHALTRTSGEFILQLDADHVPLPHILHRLLGFFEDPRVAFVQSPQDFYNTDSFSYDVNEKSRRMWEEQRIFFSLIQPGKDHWNAAFFCGSCGIIRRTAFEEIGGFRTETITEDMETSLVLHARGWKSVYYAESLAYGLAPASAGQYMVQRLRWGQGSMQVLRKYNPLFHKGLTWPQRICYFNSTISYLDGVLKLILYTAPIVFFVTGVLPIWVDESAFLVRFIPFLVLNILMFELLFRGTGFLFIAERYNMAKFWIYVLAVSGFFARGKLKFNVTPKSQGVVPFRSYAPQLILAVVTVLSLVWATLAYRYGWIDYEAPGWGSLAFWFNAAWAAYNVYFAVQVVYMSLHYKQQRLDERFRATIPVLMEIPREEAEPFCFPAVTEDLNPDGVGIRSTVPLTEGEPVGLSLPLESGRIHARGEVVHRDERKTLEGVPLYIYGIRFDDLSTRDRDAIDLHCAHHAVPIHRLSFEEENRPFRRMANWVYDARGESREFVHLPVTVHLVDSETGEPQLGYLVEVSSGGARMVVEEPPSPGVRIRYDVPGCSVGGIGEVASVRAIETPMGVLFSVGLRRTDGPLARPSLASRLSSWRSGGAPPAGDPGGANAA